MSIAEKLTAIAENEQKVYDAGFNAGKAQGGGDGAFWDAYQQNGNRKDYQLAFGGEGWTVENFKPKYDIRPTIVFEMFRGNTMETDLDAHLENLGITLDFSGMTSGGSIFYNTKFTKIGVVDISNVATVTYLFHNNTNLKEVVKLILKSDGSQTPSNWFSNCSALEEIRIEGAIGQNGFNVQWAENLSHDSLMSIINALYDYSGTSTWKTVTLGSANIAKLSAEEIAIMQNKQWQYA